MTFFLSVQQAVIHWVVTHPGEAFRLTLVAFALLGLLCYVAVWILLWLLPGTKRARAQAKADTNAALQARYDAACVRVVEVEAASTELAEENTRLHGFVAEEMNWGRNWRAKVRAGGEG